MNKGNNAAGPNGLAWAHPDKVNRELVAFVRWRCMTTNETLQSPERFL